VPRNSGSRLLVALCVAFCLLVPPLGVLVVIPVIVALVRKHVGTGIVLIVVGLLVPVAGGLLYTTFLVKPYRVPNGAMLPTIRPGDRILAWLPAGDPHVGDIFVFHPPNGVATDSCGRHHRANQACQQPTPTRSNVAFVKRVVAGPGDRLRIVGGRVILNHRLQREPLIRACGTEAGCNLPGPITIPPGHWFMLGDNRGASDDRRFWGPVPTGCLVGRVISRYWPVGRAGGV
jgi:signal peptidase I